MKVDISFDSSRLDKAVEQMQRAIPEALKDAAEEIAEMTMEESKNQVPFDTGTLQATAFVEAEATSHGAQATFGYSGEGINPKTGQTAAEYMIAVHERLDVHHPHGKAKFLEDPVNAMSEKLEQEIGKQVNMQLRKMFHG